MADLSLFGRNLTEFARQGRLDPVVGRGPELDQMVRVLCRRTKNNPLLLGEPGVGKTALAEGLAQCLAAHHVPHPLQGRELVEVQLGPLLAGTQYRGDLEKRLHDFLRHAQNRRMILFIDEIHLLAVAGRGSGMDAGNLLKPILARGEVPCIGATTLREAEEMFRIDPAMQRRFQAVHIGEPSAGTVKTILAALQPKLERHHNLQICDSAIEAAVALSTAEPAARNNPDRAIDLLEDACAAVQLEVQQSDPPPAETAILQRLQTQVEESAAALDLHQHVAAMEALTHFQRRSAELQSTELRLTRKVVAEDVLRIAGACGDRIRTPGPETSPRPGAT